jgi:hypothetical protein
MLCQESLMSRTSPKQHVKRISSDRMVTTSNRASGFVQQIAATICASLCSFSIQLHFQLIKLPISELVQKSLEQCFQIAPHWPSWGAESHQYRSISGCPRSTEDYLPGRSIWATKPNKTSERVGKGLRRAETHGLTLLLGVGELRDIGKALLVKHCLLLKEGWLTGSSELCLAYHRHRC